MAKTSSIQRNLKRKRLIEKYSVRRKELKSILSHPDTSDEAFLKAQRLLANLPRNSSPVRFRNRCSITGRSRAFYRKFGLSRITLRELVSSGEIPGVTKASW